MRILVTTVIIWAILLGFFATGVKVMATSPEINPVMAADTVDTNIVQRAEIQRDSRLDDKIQSSDQGRNGLVLDR